MKQASDKRKSAGHRLAIIEGHLRKVRRMVDEGVHCLDIITQSRAIEQALRKFDEHILEQHLKVCVSRDLKSGNSEKITRELVEVLHRS